MLLGRTPTSRVSIVSRNASISGSSGTGPPVRGYSSQDVLVGAGRRYLAGMRNAATARIAATAGMIAQEVLRKGQKALVIYGAGQIWRKNQLVKEPNLAALMDRDFPGRLYTVVRIGGIFPETEKLEGLIKISARPVLLPLKGTAFGALDANQFIGRDVPVRLFPEGLGMGEVADACVYSGRSPDRTIGPDRSGDADPDYVAEKERRRRLMPRPRK